MFQDKKYSISSSKVNSKKSVEVPNVQTGTGEHRRY
jgi:hypothetical protein